MIGMNRCRAWLKNAVLMGAVALGWGVADVQAQVIYRYENATSASIPDNVACGTSSVTRTFAVTDSFTVASVALGLDITHPYRGDVRVQLTPPGGTAITVLASASDPDDNYRIMLSSNTEGTRDDGDADPATGSVYFRRLVPFANAVNYTGNASGTWTVRICDVSTGDVGTVDRVRLVLRSAETLAEACSAANRVGFDWGSKGNNVAFSSHTSSGITLSQGATSGNAPTDTQVSFVTQTGTLGNHVGYYAMQMNTTGETESSAESATWTFSEPVHGLTMSALDLDKSDYEDYMRFEAFGPNGEYVPMQATLVGAQLAFAGDWVEADSSVASTSTNGNVDLRFAGPVSTVVVQYAQGDEPQTDSGMQFVGVSDLSYCAFDYGDAPTSYNTALSATGPRHGLSYRKLYMGTLPDGDGDGVPSASADSDGADEDGVTLPVQVATPSPHFECGSYSTAVGEFCVTVNVTNQLASDAQLVGWLDANGDGDFNDANERSVPALGGGSGGAGDATFTTGNIPANSSGNRVLVWSGLTGTVTESATFLRVRVTTDVSFFSDASPQPTGYVVNGEVEDHQLPVGTLPVTLAWVSAQNSGGKVQVEFATATEVGNVGFTVVEKVGNDWRPLHDGIVRSHSVSAAHVQRYAATLLRAPDGGRFYIVDHDVRGGRSVHGPFVVGQPFGKAPQSMPIDWRETQNSLARARSNAATSQGTHGLLWVKTPGFQRVSHAALLAAGIDLSGLPLDQIAIRFRGTGVARRIVASGSEFSSDSVIEFPADVPYSLYTDEFPYEIAADGVGVVPISIDALHADSEVSAWYWATEQYAPERQYNFASPTADPWFADDMLAYAQQPAQVAQTFSVTDAVPADGFLPSLEVDLVGVTNWPGGTPDHHVELRVGGVLGDAIRFDGTRAARLATSLPQVTNGALAVEVRVTGQTGFDFDLVNLDRIALRYPRALVRANGALAIDGLQVSVNAWQEPGGDDERDGDLMRTGFEGEAAVPGFVATGFDASAKAYALINGTWRALSASARPGQAPLWPAASGARYWFGNVGDFAVPRVSGVQQNVSLIGGAADYLILAHPMFLPELQPLVARQQARGLSVRVVDVTQIYAQYSDFIPGADAIQRYLDAAVPAMSVSYVLLVGGDTYDYKNFLGTGAVSLVPTQYAGYGEIVHYAPTDALYADPDRDGAPEFAIGRLPVRSVSELQAWLAKSTAATVAPRRAVLTTPANEPDYAFSAIHDGFAQRLPTGWTLERAYVDQLGLQGARTSLGNALNQRLGMLSFVGHSAPEQWSYDPLLVATDLAGKTGLADLVVQWGCWNSYFVSPTEDTLANAFMRAPTSGALGVVGVTSLTDLGSHEALGNLLYPELSGGTRIGDAMRLAKMQLALQGDRYRDILISATLLGDPAALVQ